MSGFEQWLYRLQLDLILFLVRFSYELEQIMSRYDFLCSMNDFGQCSNWPELGIISSLIIFSCELGATNDKIQVYW